MWVGGHKVSSKAISRSKVLGLGFLGLDKVLENCGPRANSGPQPGFVDKVLLV